MIWAFAVTMIVSKIFQYIVLIYVYHSRLFHNQRFYRHISGMMVVSIAGNRVEGLALSKLMGISFIGLILIWFLPAPYHFLMAFLPSFWIGKILLDGASFFSFYTWTDILLFVDCLIHKEVFEKSIARDLSLLRYT